MYSWLGTEWVREGTFGTFKAFGGTVTFSSAAADSAPIATMSRLPGAGQHHGHPGRG